MRRALVMAAIMAALATPVRAGPRSSAQPAPHPDESAIHLDWAAMPNGDDIERAYPPEALEHGVSGDTRILCTVEPDGTLVDCDVLEEKPAGMGFGAAAIEASRRFRMKPYQAALIHGQLPRVIIPIHWAIDKTPERATTPPSRTPARSRAAAEPFPGLWPLLPILFVGVWLVVATLLALMSGW